MLRAGGWEGRGKAACSVDWDNKRTEMTLEALPAGTEGAEPWAWFRRIIAAREPLLGSAHYKLNRQALSAASSPLRRMRSLQRTNANSPSSPWCFFTCPPRTQGKGRLLETGEIFSALCFILFCLSHLNIQKVDLKKRTAKLRGLLNF